MLFYKDLVQYGYLKKGFFPRYYMNMTIQDLMLDIHILRQRLNILEKHCKTIETDYEQLKRKYQNLENNNNSDELTIDELISDELPSID